MSEDNSNAAEAHLIGSLIDSLSNTTEDEVFVSSATPNAPDSSSSSTNISDHHHRQLANNVVVNLATIPPQHLQPQVPAIHPASYQILRHFQQPPGGPYWTPPMPPPAQFRGAGVVTPPPPGFPSYPIHPAAMHHLQQQHGRWIPPPQNMYPTPPPPPPHQLHQLHHQQAQASFSPQELHQRQQQYQAYMVQQQQQMQMQELAAAAATSGRIISNNRSGGNSGFGTDLTNERGGGNQKQIEQQQQGTAMGAYLYDQPSQLTSSPATSQPQNQQQSGGEQWESIYTPFGPVRSPANFNNNDSNSTSSTGGAGGAGRLMAQRLSLVDDPSTTSSSPRDSQHHHHHRSIVESGGGSTSLSEYELKKRSVSVSTGINEKSGANSSSSCSSAQQSATPATTTAASSPSLPPKGRSYRDVAKTKTETGGGGKSGSTKQKKTTAGGIGRDGLARGIESDQSVEKKSKPSSTGGGAGVIVSRKLSVPTRESSSDSMSEFGGSENGLSSPPVVEKFEHLMAGFLDKDEKTTKTKIKKSSSAARIDDDEDDNKSDRNVLKKNATTATSTLTTTSGDFQKIMRRKGSQTKLAIVAGQQQGRDPSPTIPPAVPTSRYAVLGKRAAAAAAAASAIKNDSSSIHHDQYKQQQRIKLNNEQVSPRFGSKSPTRKAAYINNDLSWPTKNRKNENGDWIEDEDNDLEDEDEDGDDDEEEYEIRGGLQEIDRGGGGGGDEDEEEDDDDESDIEDEETYGQRGDSGSQRAQRKSDATASATGDGSTRSRRKGGGLTNGSTTNQQQQQKPGGGGGVKKGKTKRGDSGELAKKRRQQRGVVMRWINLILTTMACYIRDAAVWLISLVTDIGHQLWEIAVYCTKSFCLKVSTSTQCAWYSMGERLRKVILCIRQKEWSILLWWRSRRNRSGGDSDGLGLEENIDLPNTGEEALRRLLSCRGQDAYSILGLRPDCTDDEVKCYYRRQAILVHPDKNACYGSDEAFKILAAAFELIGTAERRRAYDLQNLHRTKAMQELQEMLAKLKEKMEEIRSTMQCDCGGKHKRFPTERELAYARYCRKCGEKHHAREGDIWAESHWFGFLWYYYACMEGSVYDITEWAGCQKNNLKHMKPDTHLVQYRLITGRNARQFNHQQQQQQSQQYSSGLSGGSGSPSSSSYGQQQYGQSPQQLYGGRQGDGSPNTSNNSAAEDLLNRYWEERLASSPISSSKNASSSGAAAASSSSMYLPSGALSGSPGAGMNFGGLSGMDFTATTQSKFNPPSCSGDSRPRKAGRRRKPRS